MRFPIRTYPPPAKPYPNFLRAAFGSFGRGWTMRSTVGTGRSLTSSLVSLTATTCAGCRVRRSGRLEEHLHGRGIRTVPGQRPNRQRPFPRHAEPLPARGEHKDYGCAARSWWRSSARRRPPCLADTAEACERRQRRRVEQVDDLADGGRTPDEAGEDAGTLPRPPTSDSSSGICSQRICAVVSAQMIGSPTSLGITRATRLSGGPK